MAFASEHPSSLWLGSVFFNHVGVVFLNCPIQPTNGITGYPHSRLTPHGLGSAEHFTRMIGSTA